ncbi:MAG: hypothetical protein HYU51_05045 [Candidatus Rokubacteria bacterium]|nr:hypothetical protein [Candidatus Rokubacteria bacterium]
MLETLLGVALAATPFAALAALLSITTRWQRVREAAVARQIAVTDALHRELGALVSPVVTKPVLRPWQVSIPVPFRRPELLGRVVAIAHQTLARMGAAEHVEIVLTPQREPANESGATRVARS